MTDTILRTYKYRLYPTGEQEKTLVAWQQACHELHFACVIQHREAWQRARRKGHVKDCDNSKHKNCQGHTVVPKWAREGLPNRYSQSREMTEARHATSELIGCPSDTLNYVVQRVEKSRDDVIQERMRGKPANMSFPRYPRDVGLTFRGQDHRGTRLVDSNDRFGWWTLSGAIGALGALKVRMHRLIPEGAQRKEVHIKREADGWYIAFACEIPQPEPLPDTDSVVGVDLGCIHEGDVQRVAVTSDGDIYTVPDNLKSSLRRLATLQKLVSPDRSLAGTAKPAQADSNRTKRRRKKIAKLHQTIARQRKHHLQYIARMLVERADVIAFEDIEWRNLRRNGGARKRGLNRSMATAAPGKLIALVKEKAEETGRTVVMVPAAYTSQACHVCGVIGERKDLSVRQWQCNACGETHDRDVNAAKVIKQRGIKALC